MLAPVRLEDHAMSPRESAVKISGLASMAETMVNGGENEAGNHKILSRRRCARLNIGRCDSKDSAKGVDQLFLVNAATGRPDA
ncbi:MAG: hypothetical protein COC10_11205 [Sphingobium sp.]|nr:MAG: hypothetical protein COC10_11205 [Sphingobium sp.]